MRRIKSPEGQKTSLGKKEDSSHRLALALRQNLSRRKIGTQSRLLSTGDFTIPQLAKMDPQKADYIRVRGGNPLRGSIAISGAKNAALPQMAASLLLAEGTLSLANVPHLTDIVSFAELLGELGVSMNLNGDASNGGPMGRVIELTPSDLGLYQASHDLVRKMRASALVLGPLLARRGRASISLPGGCSIGARPIDLHLAGLHAMGADIHLSEGYIEAQTPQGRLHGNRIILPSSSVGATENLLMAATLARGETEIQGAAREPEITSLAQCLISMGAEIDGVGTDVLLIQGRDSLSTAKHDVPPDRIEAGTYALAAAITGGELELIGGCADNLTALIDVLAIAGIPVDMGEHSLHVHRADGVMTPILVETSPYPGFPTDLQAQILAFSTQIDGISQIRECVFEQRFAHVNELERMGAVINLKGASAFVHGPCRLRGSSVTATDLRASVALVLAGLAAEGETRINHIHHIDRGYENIVGKLAACGADIARERLA